MSVFRACYSQVATKTAGLLILNDFFPKKQLDVIKREAIHLHKAIEEEVKNRPALRTHESQEHNTKKREFYQLLRLRDSPSRAINCQHFNTYDEKSHKLSYFIGSSNLPAFLNQSIIPRVLQISQVGTLTLGRKLDWNFTFNTYAAREGNTPSMAGFSFHKDIPSNGEVTMIYSLGAPTVFKIRHPDDDSKGESFPLEENSLVLLSGESRWLYEHCVVPVKVEESKPLLFEQAQTIYRISLVLGFSRLQEQHLEIEPAL